MWSFGSRANPCQDRDAGGLELRSLPIQNTATPGNGHSPVYENTETPLDALTPRGTETRDSWDSWMHDVPDTDTDTHRERDSIVIRGRLTS